MGLELVCLVGEEFRKALDSVAVPSGLKQPLWFPTSDDLAAWLKDHKLSGRTILVKGSRGIRMERILSEL